MTQDLFITKLQDLANCYEEEQKRHEEELAETKQLATLTKEEKEKDYEKYLSILVAKDNEIIQTKEKFERAKMRAEALVVGNQRMRTLFQYWYASRDRVLQQNAELRKQLDSVRNDRNAIERERDTLISKKTITRSVSQAEWQPTTQEPALAAGDSDTLILVRKNGTQPIFMSYSPEVRFLFHQYDQWLKIPK